MNFIEKIFYKNKGCLYGKTVEQKKEFFNSLYNLSTTDPVFFEEQIRDLLPKEQDEFLLFIKNKNEELRIIKSLLDVLTELTNKKYENSSRNNNI